MIDPEQFLASVERSREPDPVAGVARRILGFAVVTDTVWFNRDGEHVEDGLYPIIWNTGAWVRVVCPDGRRPRLDIGEWRPLPPVAHMTREELAAVALAPGLFAEHSAAVARLLAMEEADGAPEAPTEPRDASAGLFGAGQ
jgi:hypothetical protein